MVDFPASYVSLPGCITSENEGLWVPWVEFMCQKAECCIRIFTWKAFFHLRGTNLLDTTQITCSFLSNKKLIPNLLTVNYAAMTLLSLVENLVFLLTFGVGEKAFCKVSDSQVSKEYISVSYRYNLPFLAKEASQSQRPSSGQHAPSLLKSA